MGEGTTLGAAAPEYDRRSRRVSGTASRLYDRQRYLSELDGLFRGQRRGSTKCVVVEGSWGTGKTALLNAAADTARKAGLVPVQARGRDHERLLRYSVLSQVLEATSLAWAAAGVFDKEALDQLAADLRQTSAGPADVGQSLASVLSDASQTPPLLIAIDDADKADNDSIQALSSVGRRLGPDRVCLLASTGPRQPGIGLRAVDWLLAEPDTRLLPIGPLPRVMVEQALMEIAGTAPDPAFLSRCWEVTGGRPLLLFALVSALGPGPLEVTADAAQRLDGLVVPQIARVILARLSKMSIAATDLLQALAVLGNEADFGDALQLAGIDGLAAERGADAAVHAELLEPQRPLRFTSSLIQSAIYHDIPPSRRARLHADAARLLGARDGDEIDIRGHLMLTEPTDDPAVAERLRELGHRALVGGDPSTAVLCFKRALAEPPTAEQRPALRLDLAAVEAGLGLPEASEHFHQALHSGVSDATSVARATVALVRGGARLPAFDDKIVPNLEEAVTALRASHPELSLELQLALSLYTNQLSSNYLSRVAADFASVLDLSVVRDSPIGRLGRSHQVVTTLGESGLWGAETAADVLESTFDADELFGADPLSSTLQLAGAVLLLRCGRFGVVDAALRAAMQGERLGGPDGDITALLLTALLSLWQGQLTAAGDAAREALACVGDRRDLAALLSGVCLVNVLLDQGRTDEARLVADRIGAETATDATTLLWVAETRARLLVAEGRLRQGLDDLLSAGRYAEAARVDNPVLSTWRIEASRAAAQLGQKEQAESLAAEALARARAFGEAQAVARALRVAAESAAAPTRVELLSEAATLLQDSPATLEAARALVDFGVVLGSVGRKEEARKALRRGAHLASLSGADSLVESAGHYLRMAGARPRRMVMTGWGSLTPAEAKVASMAAAGDTNAHIAATLVVSLKTVEGHLARAYNKLEIRSRKKLAELYKNHVETAGTEAAF